MTTPHDARNGVLDAIARVADRIAQTTDSGRAITNAGEDEQYAAAIRALAEAAERLDAG